MIPTLGSKEAIFSLAQVLVDRDGGRDLVAFTEPGYPVPERGARVRRRGGARLPLLEENGFLPDLDAVDEAVWGRLAILWINYPNNPTGATAPLRLPRAGSPRLRAEHDFVLASRRGVLGALVRRAARLGPRRCAAGANVVVFNTLSKRSSMTGYRSGFVGRRRRRSSARCGPSGRPWARRRRSSSSARRSSPGATRSTSSEARALYARKREALLPVLERKGLRVAAQRAGMYLWVEVEGGSEAFAERLLEHGVVVSPGAFLRALRRGLRPLRARPPRHSTDCRRAARVARWRTRAVSARERVEEVIAALDRGESCASPSAVDGELAGRTRRRRRRSSSTSGCARWSRRRSGRSSTWTRSRSSATTSELGVRVVPPAVARYGSFLSPGSC